MSDGLIPTLQDDEATLAEYARRLGDQVELVLLDWFIRLVDERSIGEHRIEEPGIDQKSAALTGDAAVVAELHDGATETIAAMRALLAVDIAEQPVGPLEILRRSIRFPTRVLTTAGVMPRDRDDFARRNFPDDVFDLTPASFAAADPRLHEPGLLWGAAKAHVHLRRRRESSGQ